MIKFTIGSYFPLQFQYLGYLLAILGIVLSFAGPVWGGLLLLFVAGAIISLFISTQYKIEIDIKNKTSRDYLWFMGYKIGKKQSYDDIEKVYMTSARVTQTLNQRSITQHLDRTEYSGFLRFSDDNKVHLGSSVNENKMRRRLQKLATSLNVDFSDLSQPA